MTEKFKWYWAKSPAPPLQVLCFQRWGRRFCLSIFARARSFAASLYLCSQQPGDAIAASRKIIWNLVYLRDGFSRAKGISWNQNL